MSRPLRASLGLRCLICGRALAWPSIHFCGPSCSEAWIQRTAERELVLAPLSTAK